MIPISFATVTVQVHRPGVIRDHGRDVVDYANLTPQTPISGCVDQPAGSGEDTARDLTTATRSIQAPSGADIRRFDLLEITGLPGRFRVDYEPVPWASPTGALAHLAVTATRFTEGLA